MIRAAGALPDVLPDVADLMPVPTLERGGTVFVADDTDANREIYREHLTDERYGTVPRVFIECLQDGAIPIEVQRQMVAEVPCETVLTLDTSHSPFFSAPEELVEHLLSL